MAHNTGDATEAEEWTEFLAQNLTHEQFCNFAEYIVRADGRMFAAFSDKMRARVAHPRPTYPDKV